MNLTPEEKKFIEQNEQMIDQIMSHLETVRKFNNGDYLIAFHSPTPWTEKRVQVTNSYGAPKKFQVVAVDKHGVPYVKELNKKGKPVGGIISAIHYNKDVDGIETELSYDFEVDPDYADAIIMDDQANYDAANIHKMKSDTFKAIAAHNKSIKINTDHKVLPSFLSTLKVGDLLWRSNMSSFSIIEIVDFIPQTSKNRIGYDNYFLKVLTNKGKEDLLCLNDLIGRALYTTRPRSYKELQDPK